MNDYKQLFIDTFKPQPNIIKKLDQYALLIQEYNQKINLTAIVDTQMIYLKHFYDSLTIKKMLDNIAFETLADLGTGAGFPGVLIALFYPHKTITLIEPLQKRVKFLEIVKKTLALDNIIIINKRMEDIDQEFDIIVSRAVARLNILLELAIPFVKKDGYFIALKGKNALEELNEAQQAIKLLDIKLLENDIIKLADDNGIRHNLLFLKLANTNKKYPRNFSQIKKRPL